MTNDIMPTISGSYRNKKIKYVCQRVRKWEYLPLLLLVVLTLSLHIITINSPGIPVGDENFYVEDARSIINNHTDIRPEHPELGKLFVAAGILLFGDNAVGWRIFPVLFGTIGIILFYFICKKLNISRKAALLATFLLALDELYFVQAGLAMLDIFMVVLMFTALLSYLRGEYLFAGVFVALSALCKLNGSLIFGAIFVHWLVVRRDKPWEMLTAIVATPLFFIAFIVPLEYIITGKFIDPILRINTMLTLTGANKFTIPPLATSSRPWMWFLPQQILEYDSTIYLKYLAFISWTIQLFIVPSVIYLLFKAFRGNSAGIFGVWWFVFTYISWIPVTLLTDRVTFVFYFLPTTGAICIGIGMALGDILDKLKARASIKGKTSVGIRIGYAAIVSYLVLHFTIFLIFNPAFPVQVKRWLEKLVT